MPIQESKKHEILEVSFRFMQNGVMQEREYDLVKHDNRVKVQKLIVWAAIQKIDLRMDTK